MKSSRVTTRWAIGLAIPLFGAMGVWQVLGGGGGVPHDKVHEIAKEEAGVVERMMEPQVSQNTERIRRLEDQHGEMQGQLGGLKTGQELILGELKKLNDK